MAMSKQRKKAPKTEVDDALHEICITDWDTEFRVLFQSDDMGEHVAVALRTPFMGWRLVRLEVPEGYLGVFYPLAEK